MIVGQRPLQKHSWRPGAASGSLAPSGAPRALGQASPGRLDVMVIEISGRPVKDVVVTVYQGGVAVSEGTTGSHGHAVLALVPGSYDVQVSYKDLVMVKKITREEMSKNETFFFQFPVCIVDPLFRGVDLVIFGSAAALIAAGTYFKIKPVQMTGEIALGAAIFGFIYRLQCI